MDFNRPFTFDSLSTYSKNNNLTSDASSLYKTDSLNYKPDSNLINTGVGIGGESTQALGISGDGVVATPELTQSSTPNSLGTDYTAKGDGMSTEDWLGVATKAFSAASKPKSQAPQVDPEAFQTSKPMQLNVGGSGQAQAYNPLQRPLAQRYAIKGNFTNGGLN
jgi:hypothetical protein